MGSCPWLSMFCLVCQLSMYSSVLLPVSNDTAKQFMTCSVLRGTLSVVVVHCQRLIADRLYLSPWDPLMAALIYRSRLWYANVEQGKTHFPQIPNLIRTRDTFKLNFVIYSCLYYLLQACLLLEISTIYVVSGSLAKRQVRFSRSPLGRCTWTGAPISMPLVAAVRYGQVQYLNANLDDICLHFWYVSSHSIILHFLTSNASSDASSGQCKLPWCQETRPVRPSSSPKSS